ncbi:MAG: hypothetical protein IPO37_18475 [Saprospiraceae bacterium]|jgi:hypothetical protein|nr:hypothetical protein [Saprospiraceae bacterium]
MELNGIIFNEFIIYNIEFENINVESNTLIDILLLVNKYFTVKDLYSVYRQDNLKNKRLKLEDFLIYNRKTIEQQMKYSLYIKPNLSKYSELKNYRPFESINLDIHPVYQIEGQPYSLIIEFKDIYFLDNPSLPKYFTKYFRSKLKFFLKELKNLIVHSSINCYSEIVDSNFFDEKGLKLGASIIIDYLNKRILPK